MPTHKITAEQNEFIRAVDQLGYKTKLRHYKNLGLFLSWLEQENITASQARTVDILAFLEALRNDHSAEQLHRIVFTIKTWYTCKGNKRNPAIGIKIRYRTHKPLADLLDRKALDKLYYQHECSSLIDYRDRVVLGLLVFQGLSSGDIKRLKTSHLQLENGKVHIPGSKQTNSRVLPLEACQILEMKTYLDEIRPQFNKATDQFIIHRKGKGTSLQNMINHLFRALRERYPSVKHAGQVRQSVIVEWLKEKDVRVVQYMAGHKKVKSTERYQALDLEDLQEQLNKYHPLG